MRPPDRQNNRQEHVSKNVMFWRPDPVVDAARKHPGWLQFHRQCGEANLYFDDIEKQGRGYGCRTFRLERRWPARPIMHRLAEGQGSGVIDAVLDGFDRSIAAGAQVPQSVRDLLTARPAPIAAAAPVALSDDDLLGGPATVFVDDSELV